MVSFLKGQNNLKKAKLTSPHRLFIRSNCIGDCKKGFIFAHNKTSNVAKVHSVRLQQLSFH